MNLKDLHERYGSPREIIEILNKSKVRELYPPQAKAIEKNILEGKNLVLAIPTAAGKTLIAELCMLKSILKEGGKSLYIVPLRALASEKFEEFKEKYEPIGVDVGIATGDYDVPGSDLAKHDILVATSEKIDSLLRHKAKWLADLSTVAVFDEIHLINDPGRGPTLEILAARLRQLNPELQIIGLSATISNSDSIADWLNARHVKSEWRPVPLKEGVYHDGYIVFDDLEKKKVKASANDNATKLVVDTVKNGGGQALIFVSSRRSTQVAARRASKKIRDFLNEEEKKLLDKFACEIENSLGESTKTCKLLAKYVRMGAAFHHAGLHHRQRKAVEDAFRKGLLKVICATPTLAAGVNLPSRRTIIRDYKRYTPPYGMKPIPVLEYKQMSGRAGRPGYDEYGESILIADSTAERDALINEYILSDPEEIESKLASEPALRIHVLGSIASNYVNSLDSMLEFIDQTFFAYQYTAERVRGLVEKVIDFLMEEKMISDMGKWLTATKFGVKVSQLYIDPLSGVRLRNGLKNIDNEPSDIGLLQLICSTPDMMTLYLGKNDYEDLELFVRDLEEVEDFLVEPPNKYNDPEGYEFFLSEVKTARLLQAWIDEKSEDKIHEEFRVGAGDIRRKISAAEWILYAAHEISKLFRIKPAYKSIHALRQRIKYGVKDELLELVSLRGVGRVRARSLYKAGYRNRKDILEASQRELSRVPNIGSVIAEKLKEQVK